ARTGSRVAGMPLLLGTPFFVVFGKLSDRIGRLKIILGGCLIAALTYFPLFKGLAHYVHPGMAAYSAKPPITVAATDCSFHIFIGPHTRFTDCDKAKDLLTKAGLSFQSLPAGASQTAGVVTKIVYTEIQGFDDAKYKDALKQTGYPAAPDKARINYFMTVLILWIMVI